MKTPTSKPAAIKTNKARHPKAPSVEKPHGWFRRYWLIIAAFVICAFLMLNERIFTTIGTMINVPAAGFLALLCTLITRRLLGKYTTDADSSDGTFNNNWLLMDSATCPPGVIVKCALQVIERVAYFIGFVYLCGNMIK
jgi:hypothetical protein